MQPFVSALPHALPFRGVIEQGDNRAAEARIITAGLRPNPEVAVQSENFTGSGEFKNGEQAERTLQLSQMVELGGKRPARIAVANADRELVE